VPLLQFRQYDGLTFQMYDDTGAKSSPIFDAFVLALKEYMAAPLIGPRKCMFFAGEPFGTGDGHLSGWGAAGY